MSEVEKTDVKIRDIREKRFAFAVRIVKFCRFLDVSKSLVNQSIRSAKSVGANLEEARSGRSKPDFISKNSVALKESHETNYRLRLISESTDFEENFRKGVEDLIIKSSEITKIIASIIISAKKES